ncbi:MAG: VWA domain-containing protein [Desulfovibrionaceae bacterium]|nr:VWA domain-containing protein [Desulfovibrionaceae bacterium]
MQQMLPLKEERKIILILTDGQPDSIPSVEKALDAAQKSGFEVFGIGILTNSIGQLLPRRSQNLHTLSELAPTVFRLLQNALLSRGVSDPL